MVLKGQAKTDYQREYMRKRRMKGSNSENASQKATLPTEPTELVRPYSKDIQLGVKHE